MFMCLAGEQRAPTAKSVAESIIQERGLNIAVAEPASYAVFERFKDFVMPNLKTYNRIFVMEEYMAAGLIAAGIKKERIECLDIEDHYEKDDSRLIAILREKLEHLMKQRRF